MHQTPSKLYNQDIPIEQILYGQFIKYASIESMVAKEFANSNANTVNVYVDVLQLVLPAFRCLRVENYYSMCSVIMNYAAHIRAYFMSRHQVTCNIILVYSPNYSSNNTKFIAEYNEKYRSRMAYNTKMAEVLKNNIEMLRLLCPFIPNLYLRQGTVEPSVIMYDCMLRQFNNGAPNIVFSTSEYAFQLPNAMKGNCIVFHKKTQHDKHWKSYDVSYSYNFMTAPYHFIQETKGTLKSDLLIHPAAITTFMCLTGVPGRSIKSIYSAVTALKFCQAVPEEYLIAGDYEMIHAAISSAPYKGKIHISANEFINRFKALDIPFQYKLYSLMPDFNYTGYLDRRRDVETLKEINDKYFKSIPINLQNLFL